MQFKATESYTIDPPGFVWETAKCGWLPLLTVRDSYAGGKGSVRVKLAGLFPVIDAHGLEVDYSSAVRFLSEMVWFPSAFLLPNIAWTAIDNSSAQVSLSAYGRTVSGKLWFEADGRATNFVAKRYRDTTDSDPTLWSTPATAHGTLCGFTLPVAG